MVACWRVSFPIDRVGLRPAPLLLGEKLSLSGRFAEALGEVGSAVVSGRFAEAIGEVGSAVASGRFAEGRLGVDSACVNRRSAVCALEQNGSAHCPEPPRLLMMMLVGALGFSSKVGRKVLGWLWVSLWSLLPVRVKKKRRFARVTLVGRVALGLKTGTNLSFATDGGNR